MVTIERVREIAGGKQLAFNVHLSEDGVPLCMFRGCRLVNGGITAPATQYNGRWLNQGEIYGPIEGQIWKQLLPFREVFPHVKWDKDKKGN